MQTMLPPGVKFLPTDEELIVFFLQKKLKGEKLPNDAVKEDCEIYEKEPWLIFDKTLKQDFYVFTSLKRKSKSRMERTVSCGTWKGQHTDEICDRKKKVIGYKKSFVFQENEDQGSNPRKKSSKNGRWIMHEFCIKEDDEYVLCRIKNKELDKLKIGLKRSCTFDNPIFYAQPKRIHAHETSQNIEIQRSGEENMSLEEVSSQQQMIRDTNIAATEQYSYELTIYDGLEDIIPSMPSLD